MQDTAGIFLISCNRIRLFPDMMDVSMLIQNAKEGCGLDEKELLRQLQKQRAGALETAIAQYGAYVLAVIRNRSRGVLTPEDHEEIASDVFLALWRGAKNITRGQLRPWLGAVARKQTAEAMRKKNVYLPLEDDALITLDRLWEQMVEKERCEALAQALAALPEEDREIFYRFYDLSQTTAQIEGHIASYDETTDVDITQPTYTEEEQAMIDEGTMQVPDIADLSDTGVSAETDDFTFTLESMLVSRNSLYAILRIDAKNDDAAAELAAIPEAETYQKELNRMLWVGAHNNTNFGGFGADHRLEWKNGGMSMEIMQVEGSTAYALLTNIGGEFKPGDRILFDMSHHDQNVDLFEIPVPAQLEQELVIELDESAYESKYCCWQTATITPISFRLDGRYGRSWSRPETNDAVSITLKDGTSFDLASVENDYADSAYGTYGSMSSSGTGMPEADRVKHTWLFSQLIDLADLASITVDGVTYPVG